MPLRERPRPQRDARIFVLALEGEVTGEEFIYFKALCTANLLDMRRLQIELIPTPATTHRSSPQAVLDRAVEVAKGEKLMEVWLVIDVDQWKPKMLKTVCQNALKKRFRVAVSNPCFELWLFLHFVNEADLRDDLGSLWGTAEALRSKKVKSQLKALRRQSNAAKTEITPAMLRQARRLVCQLPGTKVKGAQRWPECPGTFVSELIDEFESAGLLRTR